LTNAIKFAVKVGYRHFDCAWAYDNEQIVGPALNEAIAESNGAVKRKDLFVTSKVWDTFHSKALTRKCLLETLRWMNFDYLDLYLIHWPMGLQEETGMEPVPTDSNGKMLFSDVHYLETYRGLEALHQEGFVRNIGVSNFNIEQLRDVLREATIKPAVNQFEVNPYCQNDELVDFCLGHNVAVVGYAPFGSSQKYPDRPDLPIIVEHPVLVKLGKKYNKSAAQVVLRWGIQRNIVMLAKSVTPARIVENAQIFDFELSDEDMAEIKGLNQNLRTYELREFYDHRFYPF